MMNEKFELTIDMYPNYDKCLFEEKDGKLVSTAYFKYIAANFTKDFFKNLIQKLDTNHEYVKQSEVLGINQDDFDKLKYQYHKDNAETFKLIEKEQEQWKEDHKDFYRLQPSLPSSSKYKELFLNVDFFLSEEELNNLNISLEDAIQGYKFSNEILKTIDNKSLDKFCTEIKPMLNYEHRNKYTEAMTNIIHNHGLLTDNELKETMEETTIIKSRLSLNRQKSTSHESVSKLNNKIYNKLISNLSKLTLI